jgi:hypothetical protein
LLLKIIRGSVPVKLTVSAINPPLTASNASESVTLAVAEGV